MGGRVVSLTVGQKQELFMRLMPRLVDFVHSLGFEIRGGDLFRDPRVHGALGVKMGYGHPKSAHKLKIAIDLNLFKNGAFVEDTEAHRPIGTWWKAQHELCRWGGDFSKPDGNHYSLFHDGVS